MNCFSTVLNTLTAVGTVGATVVALWLGLRNDKTRINGVFLWSSVTNGSPTLLVQNIGTRIAVIESVEVLYDKKKVCNVSFSTEDSMKNYAIIEAGQVVNIPFKLDWLEFHVPKHPDKKRTLSVVVKPRSGHRHISKQKYSPHELDWLLFNGSLFSE